MAAVRPRLIPMPSYSVLFNLLFNTIPPVFLSPSLADGLTFLDAA